MLLSFYLNTTETHSDRILILFLYYSLSLTHHVCEIQHFINTSPGYLLCTFFVTDRHTFKHTKDDFTESSKQPLPGPGEHTEGCIQPVASASH